MMLRYSFDMESEARDIENAVEKVLADGYRTTDLYVDGTKKLSCSEMGDQVLTYI
jgi:3-isopropylmalate dehydrogenase